MINQPATTRLVHLARALSLTGLLTLSAIGCGDDGAKSDNSADNNAPNNTDNNQANNAPNNQANNAPNNQANNAPNNQANNAPNNTPMHPDPVDPACDTASGDMDPGWTELGWDDDQGVADVTGQDWSVVDLVVRNQPLLEAVRFELEHPARVRAISVQFGTLPEDPAAPVSLGLYPDFGYNGFDFWRFEALWTGARCSGNITPGQWKTYVLDEPIEVPHPGLIYVAHERRGVFGDAALLFDGTRPADCEDGQNCCEGFDQCHSAWNFPDLQQFTFNNTPFYAYNGLSLTFELDYMVRLHVEYLDDHQPEDAVFQPVEGVTLGDRSAWGDFDNDGDDDLLTSGPRLLRNDDGAFTDITEDSGLSDSGARGAGVWGDFNNDGCLDLFVFDNANNRPDKLLQGRCDGTFSDATADSGIDDQREYHQCGDSDRAPSPSAAWLDIDNDGFLDLYVNNYECNANNTYYPDQVWHNEGDGTFTEWTNTQGFLGEDDLRYAGRGANPIDFDQDGDVDLFVNNYRLGENLFYLNNGDGTVSLSQRDYGLAGVGTIQGFSRTWGHSIGAAWGDLDSDGRFDLVVANLAHPRFYDFSDKSQVLISQPDGTFADIQGDFAQPVGAAGLRFQETHSVPALGDFDHDGHLDLIISAVYDGRPSDFYWGNGDGTFSLDSYRAGIEVTNGWGVALADFDLDGDLDVAFRGVLYENRRGAPDDSRWLQITALGGPNHDRPALGATVRVEAGDFTRIRHVSGGSGQGNQDTQDLHFGLGDLTSIDRIAVRYPGTDAETLYEGPFDTNQRLIVTSEGLVTER